MVRGAGYAAAPVPGLLAEDEVRGLAHARYSDGTEHPVEPQLWVTAMGTTCGSLQEWPNQGLFPRKVLRVGWGTRTPN